MGNERGLPWPLRGAGPAPCFMGSRLARDGDQVLHLFARRDVPWQGSDGVEQGGPMYFIREGLGKMETLGHILCRLRTIRLSSAPPVNQLKIVRSMFFEPQGWFVGDAENTGNGLFGLLLAVLVGLVVVGGINIGAFASKLVPGMSSSTEYGSRYPPPSCRCRLARLFLVFSDAFTGEAVAGGVLGTVIVTGVRRATCQRGGHGDRSHGSRGGQDQGTHPRGPGRDVGPRHRHHVPLTGLVLLVTGV